jgi:hypothetical protein
VTRRAVPDVVETSRRSFVLGGLAVVATWVLRPAVAGASTRRAHEHPVPRAGITGAKVLAASALSGTPALIPLFDSVRRIPAVIDGIRCGCGCAEEPDFYSLLSCYETDEAMARHCLICQGEAKLAVRLHGEGKSLAEIRRAIDAKFG